MENKLIVRIANGFGNQMFNYAAGYAFAKRLGYTLLVDDESSSFSDIIKGLTVFIGPLEYVAEFLAANTGAAAVIFAGFASSA